VFVAESKEDVQYISRTITERLEDSDSHVREAAIEGVLKLAEQGMYWHPFQWVCSSALAVGSHEDVREIIRTIVKRLGDSGWKVRETAVKHLSRLAEQGMCWRHFPVGLPKHVCS